MREKKNDGVRYIPNKAIPRLETSHGSSPATFLDQNKLFNGMNEEVEENSPSGVNL